MKKTVIFRSPYAVVVQETPLPRPAADELLLKTELSAVSAGSEMLVYGGHFPPGKRVDPIIEGLEGKFKYPLAYGYSTVGRVVDVGPRADRQWLGRRVFAFHPHASHFVAVPRALVPIPQGIDFQDALFLANMESAVNFVMDGRPLIGERVAVFGQGVVGLLTTALLSRYPLAELVTVDRHALRRTASRDMGAHRCLAPREVCAAVFPGPKGISTHSVHDGADLVFELSGNPDALNSAIDFAGFGARVIIGSWYGTRAAEIQLGLTFHRSRIRLISSQVSTLAPRFSGRWDKQRRMHVAWEAIARVRPARLISHRFSLREVSQAYEMIARHPERCLQVVFEYD